MSVRTFGGNKSFTSSAEKKSVPPSQQGGGRSGEKPKSQWTSVVSLYDEYHSVMEAVIVADLYKTSFGIKISPVFGDRRGVDAIGSTGKKYNYDDSFIVVFDLSETIILKEQLFAFMNNALSEVIIPRLETKRVILTRAEVFYPEDTEEYEEHKKGLVISIEEDETEKTNGRNVIFISRPISITLEDGQPAIQIHPEFQALLTVIDSYLQNVARVDFASCRILLSNTESTGASSGMSAPQPKRVAASSSTGGFNRGATRQSPVKAPAKSDDDIDSAIDDVLGDVPSF
jgi:hypothetical protein